jgi:hypothetical protein
MTQRVTQNEIGIVIGNLVNNAFVCQEEETKYCMSLSSLKMRAFVEIVAFDFFSHFQPQHFYRHIFLVCISLEICMCLTI